MVRVFHRPVIAIEGARGTDGDGGDVVRRSHLGALAVRESAPTLHSVVASVGIKGPNHVHAVRREGAAGHSCGYRCQWLAGRYVAVLKFPTQGADSHPSTPQENWVAATSARMPPPAMLCSVQPSTASRTTEQAISTHVSRETEDGEKDLADAAGDSRYRAENGAK